MTKKKKGKRKNQIQRTKGPSSNNPPEKLDPLVVERMFRSLELNQLDDETRHKAQELVFEAMETDDSLQMAELVGQALDINPLCVDAIVMLGQLTSESDEEMLDVLRLAVVAGEEDLGADYFEENRGCFWGLVETRPYMRARSFLAEMLEQTGCPEEAITEYEAMLELNPFDNQGLRYTLLGLYFRTGRIKDAKQLLSKYDSETMATFAWGRVLVDVVEGNQKRAKRSLAKAQKANEYAARYLTGEKRLPKDDPDFYGIGDENEAICTARIVKPAWEEYPEALAWLKREKEPTQQ